jgi:hypothetical protein
MQRDNYTSGFMRRAAAGFAPRGQELESLAETEALRGRFFAWRGVSGRRYVCSVFQRGEEGFVADIENGVIVGVAREGAARRPLCVIGAGEGVGALRRLARELSVAEWHVRFGDDAEMARDLSGSLLN